MTLLQDSDGTFGTERGCVGVGDQPRRVEIFERTAADVLPLPPFNVAEIRNHQADAHRELKTTDGQVVARCSLWWRNPPPFNGHRLGVIGHYAAIDNETGTRLLTAACDELAKQGCTLAVGPMDGHTWRRYRVVTKSTDEPAFFLEPENPREWPEQFAQARFQPLAHYYSSMVDRLDHEDSKAVFAEQRLSAMGVCLRSLDTSRLDEELRAAYRIVTASFRNGFLYQPLPEKTFLEEYRRLQPFLRPELVMIATHLDQIVGFVFSIPDLNQAKRGMKIDTVILKTLAVVPQRAHAGLGRFLVQQTHRVARSLGYRRVIHALMHENNVSLNISARYGQPFRRYTLFAKFL